MRAGALARVGVLCLIGGSGLGCVTSATTPAEVAIDRTTGWFEHWFATGAGDSAASIFHPEGRWISPNGPPIQGRRAIAQRVRELAQLRPSFDQRRRSLVVEGDSAREEGDWVLRFTPAGTAILLTDSGTYQARWTRFERRWVLAELHAISALFPDSGAGAPGAD